MAHARQELRLGLTGHFGSQPAALALLVTQPVSHVGQRADSAHRAAVGIAVHAQVELDVAYRPIGAPDPADHRSLAGRPREQAPVELADARVIVLMGVGQAQVGRVAGFAFEALAADAQDLETLGVALAGPGDQVPFEYADARDPGGNVQAFSERLALRLGLDPFGDVFDHRDVRGDFLPGRPHRRDRHLSPDVAAVAPAQPLGHRERSDLAALESLHLHQVGCDVVRVGQRPDVDRGDCFGRRISQQLVVFPVGASQLQGVRVGQRDAHPGLLEDRPQGVLALAQRALGLQLRGQVAGHRQAGRPPVEQDLFAQHIDLEGFAVAPLVHPVARADEPGCLRDHPLHPLADARPLLGRTHIEHGELQELLPGVTVPVQGHLVDGQELQRFEVVDPQRFGVRIEQGAVQRFALAQAFFRLPRAGRVGMGAHHAVGPAVGPVADRNAEVLDPLVAAVLAAQPILRQIGGAATADQCAEFAPGAAGVFRVQAVQPFFGGAADLVVGIAEHRLPATRIAGLFGLDVPLPDPGAGALEQSVPA